MNIYRLDLKYPNPYVMSLCPIYVYIFNVNNTYIYLSKYSTWKIKLIAVKNQFIQEK